MAKKVKTKTLAEKKKDKEKVVTVAAEEVKTPPVQPVVEAPKEEKPEPPKEEKPIEVKEEKTPKEKKVKTPKNELPITPEVVDAEKEKKNESSVPSIAAGLNKISNGDRMDHNHAVDLMKMIHTEYVGNVATPPELSASMKRQFDAMALIEIMAYNSQVEKDFQQLGIRVDNTMFLEMEKVARETFGITLKGLPAPENNKQLVINFSESTPKDLKEKIAKEVKDGEDPVPDPDPNMSEEDKKKAIAAIFGKFKTGPGGNLIKGIEWARKAYNYADDVPNAAILANILQNNSDSILIKAYSNMIRGKLSKDHTILPAHALIHRWMPTQTDKEISEIVKVFLSFKEEENCKDNAEKLGRKIDVDNSLALLSNQYILGCSEEVVNGIINKKQEVVAGKDALGNIVIKTEEIRNALVQVYGFDSITDNKLKEIVKYYVKPLVRLSAYTDKSAYSA